MLQLLFQKVFLGNPLAFGGDDPEAAEPPSPQKTPVIAITVDGTAIERAVNVDTIVIPCSQNKVRIRSIKGLSSLRTFSVVCLILSMCVRRSLRFCNRNLTLVSVQCSSLLAYLYIAAFVLQNK